MLGLLVFSQGPNCQEFTALSAFNLSPLVLASEVLLHPSPVGCLGEGGPDLAREEDHDFCLSGVYLEADMVKKTSK